jgi:zinc transport system substrate-binding protein
LILVIGYALFACAEEPDTAPTGEANAEPTLVVYATSYPLAYFAERIGADAVEVLFPVPEGVDPVHWNPDPETVARAQTADLLLRHGAGDPAWLDLASLHRDRVVDTTAGVRDRLLRQQTVQHQHGPSGAHSHGSFSGTTWLDPTLAAVQAEAVAEALVERLPQMEPVMRSNLAALRDELATLDGSLERAAAALGGVPLLFSHPVYDYLQARYDLNGRSVSWEPDVSPNEAQWRALRELREEHTAHTMLWEAEPLAEIRERLAALGVESRVFAPCANRPAKGDWLSVMSANVRVLDALAASNAESASR